jgi:hypothetical protein
MILMAWRWYQRNITEVEGWTTPERKMYLQWPPRMHRLSALTRADDEMNRNVRESQSPLQF